MFAAILCIIVCLHCIFQTSLSQVSTPHLCLQNGKCLTAISEKKLNWNEAEKFCEQTLPNGRLASVNNAFENSVLASWLPTLTTDPWIGAFRIGNLPFQWTDGSPWVYTNWASGQPTGPCAQVCHASATSAGIQCQQGKWRTVDCETDVSQIICEYGTIAPITPPPTPTVVQQSCNLNNGKCFALVIGTATWTEAVEFCHSNLQRESGTAATLASVSSGFDNEIIETFLQYPGITGNVWIGASISSNEGPSWTDGSTFSFPNWAPGQPPHGSDGCVQVCLKTEDPNCVQGKWTVVTCSKPQSFICEITASDCHVLYIKPNQSNHLPSGKYFLTPPGVPAFYAYCDMETDGGGWTVFQRRVDIPNSFTFYDKTWNEYKIGFNNGSDKNFWLGNDNINALSTKDSNVELRIDLWGKNSAGYWWGKYTSFWIDNMANYYAFHIAPTSTGNASVSGNPFGIHFNNGKNFSTIDVVNDGCCHGCCTNQGLGGWWLCGCTFVSLSDDVVDWHITDTQQPSLNIGQTRMMLRKIDG